MSKFHEKQIVKCPSAKSFMDHITAWPTIIEIGKKHLCKMEWKIKSKKSRTFELIVSGESDQDQMNGIIAVMNYLHENDIEPGKVITKIDLDKDKKIDQCLVLLEEEGILAL